MKKTVFNNKAIHLIFSLGMLTLSTTVSAHASLDQDTADADSSYQGAMMITHGCEGSPTISVSIRIPNEMKRVKPMAKAGWTVETTMETLAEPYEVHGSTITEEIREISWTGGSLSDDLYDAFMFRGTLPETEQEQTLYFLTVQKCANGEFHRWIDVPEAGKSSEDLEKPAPTLKVMPAEEHHH